MSYLVLSSSRKWWAWWVQTFQSHWWQTKSLISYATNLRVSMSLCSCNMLLVAIHLIISCLCSLHNPKEGELGFQMVLHKLPLCSWFGTMYCCRLIFPLPYSLLPQFTIEYKINVAYSWCLMCLCGWNNTSCRFPWNFFELC